MGAMTVLGSLTLPGVQRSVGYARRFARDMLGEDHPALDDLRTCISECATNAIAHTASGEDGGRFTVTLASADGVVHGEVIDEGATETTPYVRGVEGDDRSEDGRGMLIVTALAAEWDVETVGANTRVWFRLTW
jgi:anti-sigma regulatory factor (Ser/Thr protein kinase)